MGGMRGEIQKPKRTTLGGNGSAAAIYKSPASGLLKSTNSPRIVRGLNPRTKEGYNDDDVREEAKTASTPLATRTPLQSLFKKDSSQNLHRLLKHDINQSYNKTAIS